jgi:hypothetical protein
VYEFSEGGIRPTQETQLADGFDTTLGGSGSGQWNPTQSGTHSQVSVHSAQALGYWRSGVSGVDGYGMGRTRADDIY